MLTGRKRVVLLIEDDADLCHAFGHSLKAAGFEVRVAGDGPEGLRIVDQELPDIVVLDLGLPTLDGNSVRDELAANTRTRDIPILVVTGTAVDADRIGVRRVIRKPIAPHELVAAVRAVLASVLGRQLGIGRDKPVGT